VSELREQLKASAANRQAMINRFGFVPCSVLKLSRGSLSRRMFLYQTEARTRGNGARPPEVYKGEEGADRARERIALGVVGGRLDTKAPGSASRLECSIMAAELVDFFIKYYAPDVGGVYLDPFMGQGVQMQVAKLRGMAYWGYDASTEFFRYIEATRAKIDPEGAAGLHIFHGDSRSPDQIPDGIGDFSFHSPPYWDIEFYGEEEAQLGWGHTYEEFLAGMEDIARAWLPKFKPGAFHVVNVNDFRRDGRFYPYHADTIALFLRAGWEIHDTWIVEGLISGIARVFGVAKNLQRIVPKSHEYAIVFRAPGGDR
jgi:hypothetical protein